MWFGRKREENRERVKTVPTGVPTMHSVDTLHAELRRLKTRVQSLEVELSVARRDIRRHDNYMYAQPKKRLPAVLEGLQLEERQVATLNPYVFGKGGDGNV